ncbi:hypothetical protein JCM8547_000638 [Rhodosporidiobolus lusitaniae]
MPASIDEQDLASPSATTYPPATHRRDSQDTIASLKRTFGSESQTRPSSLALPDLSYTNTSTTRSASAEGRRTLRRLSIGGGEEVEDNSLLQGVDGGRGAWTFVVSAFLLDWGFSYSFGELLIYLQQHDPWRQSSLASLSAIGSTLLAMQFFMPPFVIVVLRRYPEWRVAILSLSVVVSCGSMLASAWATKTVHLIILMGALGGISGAVLYCSVLMFLTDWWVERRGMASGIIFSGTSVGGTVFPFLIEAILSKHGFKVLCITWAGMTCLVYGASVWALKPRIPTHKPLQGERAPWLAVNPRLLFDPVSAVMAITTFVFSLAFFPVSFLLPTYTLNLTLSSASSTAVLATLNAAQAAGSPLIGWASDRSLPWTLSIIALGAAVTCLAAWGKATTLPLVFLFAVVYSGFTGIYSTWGAGARDTAGNNPHLSTMLLCWFGAVRGIASIIGPYIGTALYDPKQAEERSSFGRYGFANVIIFVGVLSFVSAAGGPALAWARTVREKKDLSQRARRMSTRVREAE